MKELFGGNLAPITYSMGFLESDCARAVEAYLAWHGPIQRKRGVELVQAEVGGSLEQVLRRLLPLTSVERRRFLFLPTSGPWTAYFDNGHRSTDAVGPMSYLSQAMACRAVRVACVPENGVTGRYAARILEIYGTGRTHFLNQVRSIAIGCDGQNWTFSVSGTPQPFEEIERYNAREIQARFTPEMLGSYLDAMGIHAFEEDFYLHGPASLIYKHGPIAPAAKEINLQPRQLRPQHAERDRRHDELSNHNE